MSRPYQFNDPDSTRSPLDRQPPTHFPSGQPPSFKTNVNRMKTKKWVEAKPYSYDGDDWGEYDEYDEYGADEPAPPPPKPAGPTGPTGLRQKGQSAAEGGRSFTDPHRSAGPPLVTRRNSFEAGDEYRSFSANTPTATQAAGNEGFGTSQQQPYANPRQEPAPQASTGMYSGNRKPSVARSEDSETPQHRRDFSPSALPPPLTTRMSPAPGNTIESPGGQRFPARKSSLGQTDAPPTTGSPVNPISPRERAPSNPVKPLPFIRPADIYKRVEEERQKERASLDSSRPSLDSLSREDTASPRPLRERGSAESLGRGTDTGKSLQPLETVAERKSEYLPDFNVAAQQPVQSQRKETPTAPATQQSLPQVYGISAFENDIWSSNPKTQPFSHPQNSTIPQTSPPADAGFRSVVDQAFTRTDDNRSVPPTPISKQSDSDVSRSNTNSTSGISPIMSRVPSSATSALKNRPADANSSTPAIAEETTSEAGTPGLGSRPGSALALGASHQIPRKPSPSHSRNVSSTSLPHGLSPAPAESPSPARSPAVEAQKNVPEPESAVLSTLSPTSPGASPLSTYATREADIASAMSKSPDKTVSELGHAEKESQAAFLESHHDTHNPLPIAASRDRSESPSKGRVQELAGKFGEVSHSRRGSTQSNLSRDSVQSWERSPANSRPSSPNKSGASSPVKQALGERPIAGREASFRPKLPGTWESYATTAGTISEHGDTIMQPVAEPVSTSEPPQMPSPLEEVDLTPTTTKRTVASSEPSEADPMAALKAAGNAMGEAIQASAGLGSSSDDLAREKNEAPVLAVGDTPLRPLQLDRTTSSIASSIPPTPPEKDTLQSEFPPPPPLKEKGYTSIPPSQQQTPTRPEIVPQLSTAPSEPSEQDQESDKLRKEIVASLSPVRTSETGQLEPSRTSLQPSVVETNRASSILPSEYDSYWADGGHPSRPSNDLAHQATEHSDLNRSSGPSKLVTAQTSELPKPTLLTRFSWEDTVGSVGPIDPNSQAQAGAQAPAAAKLKESEPVSSGDSKVGSKEGALSGIPDQYFGPVHTAPSSKPDPVTKSERTAQRSPSPPPSSSKPLSNPTQADDSEGSLPTHAKGLHIVNDDENPEAVDMPPRLSVEPSPAPTQPEASKVPTVAPRQSEDSRSLSSVPPAPVSATESTTKSPTSDKPLGSREIVALKSATERIATYNKTREYWASADHGLSDWITATLAANPNLAMQPVTPQRPPVSSTTSRHKATGSLSLFGKHSSSPSQSQSLPYSNNSAASQLTSTPTQQSSSHGVGASGPGGGRSASHQMQAKGKDLLHTAGVLGGKGMTSAKGLFAKGRSRFSAKGDKVDN